GPLFRTARPCCWEEYYNYDPEALQFARLRSRFGSRRFPSLALFRGPSGSGKTTGARVVGAIGACQLVKERLKRDPDSRSLKPCGICERCLAVQAGEDTDGGYYELDGTNPN